MHLKEKILEESMVWVSAFFTLLFFIFSPLFLTLARDGGEAKLEEIVVTATRTEKKLEQAPTNVSIVTKERIELKAPKTIDQAVNDVSGVYLERSRGIIETRFSPITVRGVPGQPRNLILRDGIILNDPSTAHARFGGFYPEDLDRVEIVKGPFSSLYGGYAMGGVMNLITKTPEKRELVFRLGYGSSWERNEAWDDLKRVYISYGDRLRNKVSLFLSYGAQSTNGFPMELNVTRVRPPINITGYEETRTPTGVPAYLVGHRGETGWWDDGITFKAQYEPKKDSKVHFSFIRNRYEHRNSNPETYLRDQNGNPVWNVPGPIPINESTFLSGGGGRTQIVYAFGLESILWGDLQMKMTFSYFKTEKDWYVTPLQGATRFGCNQDPTRCGTVTTTPAQAQTIDVQFSLPILGNQILTFGGSIRNESGRTDEEYLRDWRDEESSAGLKYESRGKDKTYALFVQDEIMLLNNLTVYIGFRQDWWKTYNGYVNEVGAIGYPRTYPSRSASSFSPKFALIYTPSQATTIRGSIGKAFRPPTILELYRDFTPPDRVLRMGNPFLKPEKVLSWDLSVERKLWLGAKASLTYFDNYLSDLIYYRDLDPQRKQLVNVGKAESRGVEFDIEQRFERWLRLFANITYTHSEIKENEASPRTIGCSLTYVPLWTVNSGVEFERSNFSASLVGRYVAKRYLNDDNSDRLNNVFGSLDPYFLLDVRVAYELTNSVKVSFTIDNVLNRRYYTWHKAPGRSWFATFTLKF